MRPCTLLVALLAAAPAAATEHNRPADIEVTCNAHGAVVTLGPDTVDPGAVFYLGKECDAFRPGRGKGRWWYAASAFIVDIDGQAIRFANELDCQALTYCRP